jgi:hypothetical protein
MSLDSTYILAFLLTFFFLPPFLPGDSFLALDFDFFGSTGS